MGDRVAELQMVGRCTYEL